MVNYYLTNKGLLPIFSEVCDCDTASTLCGAELDTSVPNYIFCRGSEGVEPFPYDQNNVVSFGEPVTEEGLGVLFEEAVNSRKEFPVIAVIDVDPINFPKFDTITDLVKSCDSFLGKKIGKMRDSNKYFVYDSEYKIVEEDGKNKIAEVFTPEEKEEAEKSIENNPDANVKKDDDGNIEITDSDKDVYSYKKDGDDYLIYKNGEFAYKVSKTGSGTYKCSCTGYKYRGKCRHIDAIMALENKRKPRESVDEFMPEIKKVLSGFDRWEVVGSYRRNSPTIKDVDIIVQCEPGKFRTIEDKFKEDPEYKHVMSGNDIIRGTYHGMDMDITRVNEGEWGSYLLYRTGPASFNIKMRADAKKRGWKLNEHGLWDENGDKLASESEEDIFEALGMDYIEPSKRV